MQTNTENICITLEQPSSKFWRTPPQKQLLFQWCHALCFSYYTNSIWKPLLCITRCDTSFHQLKWSVNIRPKTWTLSNFLPLKSSEEHLFWFFSSFFPFLLSYSHSVLSWYNTGEAPPSKLFTLRWPLCHRLPSETVIGSNASTFSTYWSRCSVGFKSIFLFSFGGGGRQLWPVKFAFSAVSGIVITQVKRENEKKYPKTELSLPSCSFAEAVFCHPISCSTFIL